MELEEKTTTAAAGGRDSIDSTQERDLERNKATKIPIIGPLQAFLLSLMVIVEIGRIICKVVVEAILIIKYVPNFRDWFCYLFIATKK